MPGRISPAHSAPEICRASLSSRCRRPLAPRPASQLPRARPVMPQLNRSRSSAGGIVPQPSSDTRPGPPERPRPRNLWFARIREPSIGPNLVGPGSSWAKSAYVVLGDPSYRMLKTGQTCNVPAYLDGASPPEDHKRQRKAGRGRQIWAKACPTLADTRV